ncbi:MAG: FAD-binding protein [Candidatus Bipolaricaulota bacterium]|nr:MAG: FAD-binding protein [Candidatus Bipolaricaulota bacterium]
MSDNGTLRGGYPEAMRASIEAVEATRSRRLAEGPVAALDAEEREALLEAFHPDYKAEKKRALRVGPSRGELMPHEVADVFEAYPRLDPASVDVSAPDLETKVLILGGGGAATVAALMAVEQGVLASEILIATKLRHGDCNTIMAQGGIQAADRAVDSPAIHYLDAIGGGHFTNRPELVRALVGDGPMIIDWHERLGILYDKVNGEYLEAHGGGTSRMRMHSAKDYTGMELMRVLRDEVRNLGIPVLEFAAAVELVLDDKGRAAGAVLVNLETDETMVVRSHATVLATGGFGRLHIQGYPTTNHYGATADGLVLAYRAGAAVIDMDSVQYHPTGVAYPAAILGQLATEKLRNQGAEPVNAHGEAFVYPLEPRDVESAAIIRECYDRDNGVPTPSGVRGVWLDTPMIEEIHGKGTIKQRLAAMWMMWNRHGIDIAVDPALVFPTLHYQNGGVVIDEHGATAVPGLFAGGEVAGGVHGKNRLMGNSLLDCNVFGRRAGMSAASWVQSEPEPGRGGLAHVERYVAMLHDEGIEVDRRAPVLLPDYRREAVVDRAMKAF